jgi:hypothetical protein
VNAPANNSESTALAVAETSFAVGSPMDAASLILGPAFDRVQAFAALMCKGAVTVPQHLRGNPGDCMAVTLAALSRRMDPFAFAQKTHITKSGALGYESQLIKAMIITSGKVEGLPEYEFLGDWNRILGKVEEATGGSGGKYYKATYTKKDEEGLGVIIRWRLRGETVHKTMTVMLSQCYPRFSTQWATDPQQQICYVADRKFARRYCPDTLLGVYDVEELEPVGGEKFMGPADVVQPQKPATYPEDQFAKNLPAWHDVIRKGRKTADQIIAMAETKYPLTDAQKAEVRKVKADAPAQAAQQQPAADQPQDVQPKTTFAIVSARINAAKDHDELDAAKELIGEVADPQHRTELVALAEARGDELAF